MPRLIRISLLPLCLALFFASLPVPAQLTSSVLSFGAIPDGIMLTDGSMTANSPILFSASGLFTPTDKGKYIQVVGAGPGATSNRDAVMSLGSAVLISNSASFASKDVGRGIVVVGAGLAGANLVTSIQSYSSHNSITLSAPAQTAVTNAPYYVGAMTLEAQIASVQSASSVTLDSPAQAPIDGAMFAYGTDNHLAFQSAVDAAGQLGGGQVNVPGPSTCPGGAVCGYIVTSTDQQSAQAPGSVKIRYSGVSLIGDPTPTNLFCRGAYRSYTGTTAFGSDTGNIRGFCLTIGDNGGDNGVGGTSVSNVTIANLHLYGMTNGNTNQLDFAYPPQTSDSWDITHKGIYMWDKATFSNITIDSVTIQDFKAENIYSGGSVITGMVIKNCTMKNFNGNGISVLANDLQVLNNNISNGSNAAVEDATASVAPKALVRQLYQGNTISQFPREGIVITGTDDGVATGSVSIIGNTFDTIAQSNASGAESAVYITGQTVARQATSVAPANVTVSGNTCHDCNTFGVFQTSGNTLVADNTFIVDQYNASAVFSFTYQLSNTTFSGNTGLTTALAQANNRSVGDVFQLVPPLSSGGFQWNNVVLQGNSWAFPGAPEYQFVTTTGPGWDQVSGHNLRWEGDVCTGCTHPDADHGLVNLAATKMIEPYGPTVYLNGNTSPVSATVDAGKEEDQAQVQIVNAGTSDVSFASDANLDLPFTITLPGGNFTSVTFVYSSALGKFSLLTGASNLAVSGGNNQDANLDSAFAAPLQVIATDSNNNPVAGATIVFSAPANGATALFSGYITAAVVTGANGLALSPIPTANGQPGSFAVTAAIAGAAASTTFNLANVSVNGEMGALSGSGNSSTATANLTLEGAADWIHWGDAALNRKRGVTPQIVNYTRIGSSGVNTYSNDPRALLWTDGSPDGLGNNKSGIYIVSPQNGFAFSAPADTTPRTLTVHVGGWQSGGTLTAHLSDSSASDFVDSTSLATGQYDRNYTLTYAAVAAGQTLTVSWVNSTNGGNVTLNAAALALAAPTIAATSGTPQSAIAGTTFASVLQATVKDVNNNPLSGVTVTFTAPATGASGAFDGSATATALTDAAGVATAPTLTANSQAGAYTLTANVADALAPAVFSLTNTTPPASIAASGGTPQSANAGNAFLTPLQATVTDANNNPVSGVAVTFTAPASGVSASFGVLVTATATTNALGVATAPTLTANGQAGIYQVTASVAGVSTAAAFSLTNAGAPASIAASGGTPQSAAVGTVFTTALQAAVKDANNTPVSGITVTFTAPGVGASAAFNGLATATAITNAGGIATAPALTANSQVGSFSITASAAGLSAAAGFALTNNSAPPASIAAAAGTPQSATVGTVFTTALQALVKDASGNPVSGVTVTFTAPGVAIGASFGGSPATAALTNASGIATAPTLTANTQSGAYAVTASVAGVAAAANFALTNVAGAPAGIVATAGTPQSAIAGTAFAMALQAAVKDANNNPLSGVTVTFTAPATGAGAAFSGSLAATAVTNAAGIATAPTLTANSQAGSYSMTASVPGASTFAAFALTNSSGPPASVSPTVGTPQSAAVGSAFTTALQALVKDVNSNPVSGVIVTFTAPGTGANATFNGSAKTTAMTNAAGVATASTLTANSQIGSYTVTAAVTGVAAAASFSLTNAAAAPASVAASAGTPQSASVGTNFATALQATVKDANRNPVSGVMVTFTAPATGAGALFSGLAATTAMTNAAGIATAPAPTATTQPGAYTVTASVAGVAATAGFSLINTSGSPASVSAAAGTPQSTNVGAAFATALQAAVKDANGNPVSGVTVTFTAPGPGGAAATFNGSAKTTALTNASGIATAPTLKANSQLGSYTVAASVTGVAAAASFSLNNAAGAPASITATAGSPQSASVGAAFAMALQAVVKDANNNPVSGMTVTFTAPATGASAAFIGSNTATALTTASGVATAPALTANGLPGGYAVTASVPGAKTPASFKLTNIDVPSSIAATGGTPQNATVGTAFSAPLQATVKDANNNPVSGVTVTFTVPAAGAGAAFNGLAATTAITNAGGIATAATLTANSHAGGFTVTAAVTGAAAPASFVLTNLPAKAVSIAAAAGTPQSGPVTAPFATTLQAAVKDTYGNPVAGVTVTFSTPTAGASATFSGSATAVALTNAGGLATAPALTANQKAGAYTVKAAVTGIAASASFSVTNLPGAPASVSATAGTPQTTTVSTAFATALQATVTDAVGNAVSGVTVTFTAPATGVSAAFSGSATTTAVTNASGVAIASGLTANGQTGSFTIAASVAGVSTAAGFAFANTAVVSAPPSLVQQAAGVNSGNNQDQLTVTLLNTPNTNNVLILFFDQVSASQTITSITGATWTRLAQNYSSNMGDAEIWVGVSPSSTTITITGTNYFGTFQPGYAIVAEFAGLSPALDGPPLLTASGTWPLTTGKLSTGNPADLLITSTLSSNGGGLNGIIKSPWTLFNVASADFSLTAAYQIVSAPGSYSATWNGKGSPRVATITLALKAGSSN